MEIEKIKKIVCKSIGITEKEFNLRTARTHVKFAQYIFCHFAYKELPNKERIRIQVGATHINKVNEYLRKHKEFIHDSEYNKLTIMIGESIDAARNN